MKRLVSAAAACIAAIGFSAAQAAVIFTDWTSVDIGSNVATGKLGSVSVTFSGGDINFGVTDGTSTVFNNVALFAPALASSDAVQFYAFNLSPPTTYSYTVSFGAAVTDPIIHLQSLASVLSFNTTVTEVIGDLGVSGSTVTGQFPDVSGTIQLTGSLTGFSFTTSGLSGVSINFDAVNIQIGADIASVPEPGSVMLLLVGLALMSLWPRTGRLAAVNCMGAARRRRGESN